MGVYVCVTHLAERAGDKGPVTPQGVSGCTCITPARKLAPSPARKLAPSLVLPGPWALGGLVYWVYGEKGLGLRLAG